MALLRDLSEKLPSGKLISGTNLCGLFGAQILAETATGDDGPGLLANDDLEAGIQYFLVMASPETFPGTVYENGSVDVFAAVSTSYELYGNNLFLSTGPAEFAFGPPAERFTARSAITRSITLSSRVDLE